MPVWWAIAAIVIAIVAAVISIVMRPKQVPPYPAQLSDFTAPTADAGRPIPVVFGTVLVQAPNVVWYGDLSAKPIKMKGK